MYPKEEVPENENSRRIRKRNLFRLFHAQVKARKGGDHTHLPSMVLASTENVEEGPEEKAVC